MNKEEFMRKYHEDHPQKEEKPMHKMTKEEFLNRFLKDKAKKKAKERVANDYEYDRVSKCKYGK